MKPDEAPAGAAPSADPEPATAKPGGLAPKRLLVGGLSALALLLLVAAAAAWFWPHAAAAPAQRATTGKAAARGAAAASAAATASTPVRVAASMPIQAAAAAPAQAAPALPLAAAPTAPAVAPAPPRPRHDGDAPQSSALAAAVEEPVELLRRRLGQVLGARGDVDAARAGELRVLTRGAGVAAVAHATTGRPAASAALPENVPLREQVAHWSYEGRGGPQAWGRLKPEFRLCATGRRQSPIDIRDGLSLDLDPVVFDYKPGRFGVVDNGYTVLVNVAPGNAIEVAGRRWELLQFHFHRPSEERLDGRRFEMDVHLVHRDAEGRLAVVAVLLERGAAQPLLQTVWNNLPLEKNQESAVRMQIDPSQLLPADRRYYTYMGSLTTPPCSEGVLWLVMQQPVQMSAEQIDIFARLYPMNARPIQHSAGRMIKQSN